jgi:5-methylcytosine-specific restriction endonuclease McrA
MIFDFTKGIAADEVSKLIGRIIEANSDFKFQKIEVINIGQISTDDKHFYLKKGEEKYLMFAYLPKYHTKKYARSEDEPEYPKYHICICQTREQYSGYKFSNSMPVSIYCKDTGDRLKNINLPLCKNCQSEVNRSVYRSLSSGKSWADYILDLAAKNELPYDRVGQNGYSVYWKQISYAKRSIDDFTCQECNIQLSEKSELEFLEVHHKDRNKLNNYPENLETLCTLCHSRKDEVHIRNFSSGLNKLKVVRFINLYSDNSQYYLSKN